MKDRRADEKKSTFLSEKAKAEAAEATAEAARLRRELANTQETLAFYKDREDHFIRILKIADGGRYRADWAGAIHRLVEERDSLRKVTEMPLAAIGMNGARCAEEARLEVCKYIAEALGIEPLTASEGDLDGRRSYVVADWIRRVLGREDLREKAAGFVKSMEGVLETWESDKKSRRA